MITNPQELLNRLSQQGVQGKLWKDSRIYLPDLEEKTEYGICKVYFDLSKEDLIARINYDPKFSIKSVNETERAIRQKHITLTRLIHEPTYIGEVF